MTSQQHHTKKSATVIGNGPSRQLHTPQQTYTICCNLAWHIPHDVVSIIDPQPIRHMSQHNLITQKTIWCTPQVKQHCERLKLPVKCEPVYKPISRFNSGHQAVKHLLMMNYQQIDLYGMDVLYNQNIISLMDQIIPREFRARDLPTTWLKHWQQMFDDHPSVKFYIHGPMDSKLRVSSKNVHLIEHLKLRQ